MSRVTCHSTRSESLNTTCPAIGSIARLYSISGLPGGGQPRPSYSGPPIQITVIRDAMRGSMSQALASSVRPPPNTANKGRLVSSRMASRTIASAPAEG